MVGKDLSDRFSAGRNNTMKMMMMMMMMMKTIMILFPTVRDAMHTVGEKSKLSFKFV